ncbi:MAG: BREX system serine/threonine kinase PglW [Pirellula sp.]|nr:BREX system serine/threonine kinase PglW [Pirellula sp.]
MTKKNWTTVTESSFPHEREALEFVRSQFPDHDPYRAWSNFEFIADDGSIYEVDLLVFTPQGFFLIEIKSWSGRISGDAGTWTCEKDRFRKTFDNPYHLANSKAKKLRSLLGRQKAAKGKGQIPFIEALVFCSAENLQCDLQDNARFHVCLRDRAADGDKSARPGIVAAIKRRECEGLDPNVRVPHNTPTSKIVAQAIEQAGIRPSQRSRKVSDYVLDRLVNEGPGFQDWEATHATLKNVRRRVRIYNVRASATSGERQTIERAAKREGELLEMLQHPGVLRREGFTEHELGPALIFEHDPTAMRLDHFLTQHHDQLTIDHRLDLLRQISEVVRFAHDKRVVHRSLSPQSILVQDKGKDAGAPVGRDGFAVKVFNWQVGYRSESNSTSNASLAVSATSHVDRLVDDGSTAYMAPEATTSDNNVGEHLDIFSLGAIAYHIFSGSPPASNGLELSNKLRETKGLQISSVLNGASESLQEMIQWSTLPVVADREGLVSSVDDFLDLLEKVEVEAKTSDAETYVEDPDEAKTGDLLPGGFRVLHRLGKGASSVGLLVEHQDQQYILKAAIDPDRNDRIGAEAEVLDKLRHSNIVEIIRPVEIGNRAGFLMRPVLVTVNEEPRVETLARRLNKEGKLHVDLLQRFGECLLDVLKFLEKQGINHRDIKPDNIAIGHIGSSKQLELVLFDFSLARAPLDNIRAGTATYLDPFLPLRKSRRWDLHAERYAAAITLYEMAGGPGSIPKWGDGASDPSHLQCEATIDGDLFDASLRDNLMEFFTRAFRRNPDERFDNAEAMLDAWRDCFVGIEDPSTLSDHVDEEEVRKLLAIATLDTQIPELGLGTRATNALDRANILTVEDLLSVPMRKLLRLRGVGNKTRREIAASVRILRERLGTPQRGDATEDAEPDDAVEEVIENVNLSVDQLFGRITRIGKREGDTARDTLQAFLGLDPRLPELWPSQTEIAPIVDVTRGRIGQLVGKFQSRWCKDAAVTKMRSDLVEILTTAGGVLAVKELAEALLVARGSVEDDPRRTQYALALARACTEAERTLAEPRFLVRRDQGRVFIALTHELAGFAGRLGELADQLAMEDPLVPPARVLQRLREVTQPAGTSLLGDARLLRLAAAASKNAAVSSRQELHPRGMDAARALKLSQGAIYGVPTLTVAMIRDRVSGRYPEAAPVPDRPQLDTLLQAAGFDFEWDSNGKGGGCYVARVRDVVSITSGSESISRVPTSSGSATTDQAQQEITPEIADARQFEERLERGIKEGSFLALIVNPKCYQRAVSELQNRFSIEVVDIEGLIVDTLRDVASKANAKWDALVNADAKPGSELWKKFMVLVNRAMPIVESSVISGQSSVEGKKSKRSILLIYPGLLARYEQLGLLEKIRDEIGRSKGLHSCWILIPGDNQAFIDGKPVPIISPGQKTKIPDQWIRNEHRGRACRPVAST